MNPITSKTPRAFFIALGAGAAGFLVHVIAGRAEVQPLFAAGVVVVWAVSAGFPVLVYLLSGRRAGRTALALAYVAGVALTTSTLGATRDTGFEAVNLLASVAITAAAAGAGWVLLRALPALHSSHDHVREGATR